MIPGRTLKAPCVGGGGPRKWGGRGPNEGRGAAPTGESEVCEDGLVEEDCSATDDIGIARGACPFGWGGPVGEEE